MTDQNNAPERIWLTDSEAELFGCYDHDFNGEGHISYTLTDRAAPEGQVDREQVVQLCLKIAADRRAQAAGDATVDQKRRSLAGAIQAEIIAEQVRALTPPPAAPTDNTALVEAAAKAIHDGPLCANDEVFDPETHHGQWCIEVVKTVLAALASHEAPPAAQEPVAWLIEENGEGVSIFTRDSSLAGARRSSPDFTVTPLYAAPPPACQQEAVTVAEASHRLIVGFMLDCNVIGHVAAAENLVRGIKDHVAALRTLKGER
ncbi:hypothetical protein [Paracoccus yeei]|nr:hypothetical protein [Paracoccus yeei]